MFRRIVYTGQKPDIPAVEYIRWIDSPFDELMKKVGSVDMLYVDNAYMRNESIDAIDKRIITPETQRKVRIIKILNIDRVPARFGSGYIHKDGNGCVITECPTESETIERLNMFNEIGVYIIRLASWPDRVATANELGKALDMIHVTYIDGVEASRIEMKNLDNDNDRFLVTYPEDPNEYVYSKTKFDMGKMSITNGMRKTEMGCALAHLRVYRQFLQDGNRSMALVFEDDTMIKNNNVENVHRSLFYYPYESLGYCNMSECVDWYPLDLDSTINSMYFRAQRKPFNRTSAYTISKESIVSLFNYIHMRGNTYWLIYVSDDILCRLAMEGIVRAGAPYYRPFTLKDMQSTIES